jgi:hypothetical protein
MLRADTWTREEIDEIRAALERPGRIVWVPRRERAARRRARALVCAVAGFALALTLAPLLADETLIVLRVASAVLLVALGGILVADDARHTATDGASQRSADLARPPPHLRTLS